MSYVNLQYIGRKQKIMVVSRRFRGAITFVAGYPQQVAREVADVILTEFPGEFVVVGAAATTENLPEANELNAAMNPVPEPEPKKKKSPLQKGGIQRKKGRDDQYQVSSSDATSRMGHPRS